MPAPDHTARHDRGVCSPDDDIRQARINALIAELATIRQARRHGDVELRRRIEAELVSLIDAQITSRNMARRAEGSIDPPAVADVVTR